ncbi:MAG: EthD domain-containing protein [Ginsengibacter sp.]
MQNLSTRNFSPNPDGSDPAYYRMAELYFESPAEMQVTMESMEGEGDGS